MSTHDEQTDRDHRPWGAAVGPTPTTTDVRPRAGRSPGSPVWLAGGAVAAGAGIATAHGLYEVAVAARVPGGIAWLYPLITDGLALVAYAATTRLHGRAARYAWAVVILAAGLSGLAQAAYLATDPGAVGQTGALLRFGVGAWPALAAAITAHLLYLLASPPDRDTATGAIDIPLSTDQRATWSATTIRASSERADPPAPSGVGELAGRTAATGDRSAEVRARVQPAEHEPDHPAALGSTPVRDPAPDGPAATPSTVGGSEEDPSGPAERAAVAAAAHRRAHGAWPSVRALAATADVAHGTAQSALRQLRNQPENPTTDLETTP